MELVIKWTNRCALFSILLLLYWVFTFIAITVFDFKVFRENLTEIFFLSILGILALMSGSLVVNIMFNLTKISASISNKYGLPDEIKPAKMKKLIWGLLLLFPLIFGFLYTGDLTSTVKREKMILKSAEFLVSENEDIIAKLADYKFDKAYINSAANALELLEEVDEDFPNVDLIVSDKIENKEVYLTFDSYNYQSDEKAKLRKVKYIFSSSDEERKYLHSVFFENNEDFRFTAHDGFYELYYPVTKDEQTIILYLTDRKRYGKIGS